jgi:hypothetical protein
MMPEKQVVSGDCEKRVKKLGISNFWAISEFPSARMTSFHSDTTFFATTPGIGTDLVSCLFQRPNPRNNIPKLASH